MTRHLKKIKFALVFNRTGKLNMDGTSLIQIRAYQNGRNRFFKTGIFIEPEFWDERNKRIKDAHTHSYRLNKDLRDELDLIERFAHRSYERYGFCSLDSLDEYREMEEIQKGMTFIDFCELRLSRNQIKNETRRNQSDSFRKLKAFRKEIYFEDINYSFVNRFDQYLRGLGLAINTVRKHHRYLKAQINAAIKEEYIVKENPYSKFKLPYEETKKVFLRKNELLKIEALEIPAHLAHLEKIRKMFLLSCYTGLRISDLVTLAPCDIEQTEKGLLINDKREKKNRKIVRAPLWLLFKSQDSDYSKPEKIIIEALNNRVQIPGKDGETYPLFRMTKQHYRRELKKLARLAGIKKKVTSHVGRRTFATALAASGVPPLVIQKLMNHSDIKTTMIYIQMTNETVVNGLENVTW
jgi:integrase